MIYDEEKLAFEHLEELKAECEKRNLTLTDFCLYEIVNGIDQLNEGVNSILFKMEEYDK